MGLGASRAGAGSAGAWRMAGAGATVGASTGAGAWSRGLVVRHEGRGKGWEERELEWWS